MAHLPSLQTLRAFDRAARHGSYSRAADELGLTHGAVSHRIRALEARVGQRLFVRNGNAMLPTAEAQRLLMQVRHALDLLEATFPTRTQAQRLDVSVLPSFASRWLVPRIGAFREAHPEIDLRLDARLELVELGPGGMDCAVRFGTGGWPGTRSIRLAGERLYPVCTPAYRSRSGLVTPADLAHCRLLRHDRQLWSPWLQAAGLAMAEPWGGPTYTDTGLLLEAALADEGVALARHLLVAHDVASGRLVRPFATAIEDAHSYYLVTPPSTEAAAERATGLFADWLTAALRDAPDAG